MHIHVHGCAVGFTSLGTSVADGFTSLRTNVADGFGSPCEGRIVWVSNRGLKRFESS